MRGTSHFLQTEGHSTVEIHCKSRCVCSVILRVTVLYQTCVGNSRRDTQMCMIKEGGESCHLTVTNELLQKIKHTEHEKCFSNF